MTTQHDYVYIRDAVLKLPGNPNILMGLTEEDKCIESEMDPIFGAEEALDE